MLCGSEGPDKSDYKALMKCEECKECLIIDISKKADEIEERLGLEHVKLLERFFLVWALLENSLEYPRLAHAYLEISRVLYEFLKNTIKSKKFKIKFWNTKLKELKIGFRDLLKLVQNIQEKGTKEYEPAKKEEGKKSVWNNKNNLFNSLSFYETVMQNLKTNKYGLIFGVIAIIISVLGLIF